MQRKVLPVNMICLFLMVVLLLPGISAEAGHLEDISARGTIRIGTAGTNEKFARANLKNAQIIVHNDNADIPRQIAEGKADIMITETVEAAHYVRMDKRLAAPLKETPFTRHSCDILMEKGNQEWLNYINFVLAELRMDGTLARLEEKYLK